MSDITKILRPRKFKGMIGTEKLTHNIQDHFKKKGAPNCWLFSGPTGVGKTTIARIMAVSYECRHRPFGSPCTKCRHNGHSFDIVEVNASDNTGINDLRSAVEGAFYVPKPGNRARVYILDEAHQLSPSAQNLLLKYTEDCPYTTKWIICTTQPDKILSTLRGRCMVYQVPLLGLEDVRKLVKKGLNFLGSKRDVGDLVDQLMTHNIRSGRNILRAVQKYANTDATAEEAAQIGNISDVDIHNLCRAVYTGDWKDTAKILGDELTDEDIGRIRGGVAGYLRQVLLGESEMTSRSMHIAGFILMLYETQTKYSPLVAVLHKICKYFSKE